MKKNSLDLLKMVYSRIYIIAGVKVSDETIKAFLTEKGFYHGDPEELGKEAVFTAWKAYKSANPKHLNGTKLYSFPCCSECTDWLLGRIIHTVYRQHTSCRNCQEHSSCELCFGQTSYGWYDIDKIFSEAVEIPAEKICIGCHSDQVNGMGRCKICFMDAKKLLKAPRFGGGVALRGMFETDEQSTQASYFYMLNDCLSCT